VSGIWLFLPFCSYLLAFLRIRCIGHLVRLAQPVVPSFALWRRKDERNSLALNGFIDAPEQAVKF
jgi:hypothetical protein